MKAYVDNSTGVITAINPHVGYETAARIAREANLTGKMEIIDLRRQREQVQRGG